MQANGKLLSYYLVFWVVVAAFLVLLRIVNSPFGRVLAGDPREPVPRRGARLPHRLPPHDRDLDLGARARRSRALLSAIWLRYVGPDTALSFSIQVDVLVMVVVGGMGSLYGAIIGAALFVVAESYLQDLMAGLSTAAANAQVPLLPHLFDPDRWLLWLGLLFVLAVYFAPAGIVGSLKPAERRGK